MSDINPTSGEGQKPRNTHNAACHCGNVKFTVTLDKPFPLQKVNKCNCTICTQKGYVFVYPPRRDIKFTQGYETMGAYKFNTKLKTHKFCTNCGTSILIDFHGTSPAKPDPDNDILAINVRNFTDIDMDAMEYTYFDGRKLIPRVD
ncbi:hypothetical protein ONS95_007929 [Cadophora gregata]|uniref:uncharacterized protein n=1 Tax=Cadophora gregata TaxID=51156 RepID=UPI0026DB6253|nr:uncharacterized protein ONS95_007929 [Cadophora gregata]KAK0119066.1 hypothetical protein ONS96_012134 [Cadophora gregata f. sp. sojae]KAK0126320.1 hypothetical protein ONS95_007929 [Cadophora gregata]